MITHEIGTENSVLKCNTFARTGGSATYINANNNIQWEKHHRTCLKNSIYSHGITLRTGVSVPSFIVKRSDRDNDWEVCPCLRKTAPFSPSSFANCVYSIDRCSAFAIAEPAAHQNASYIIFIRTNSSCQVQKNQDTKL